MCIYSECVSVALFTRHSKCMRCIIMLFVACQAVQYFSTFYHTRHDTRKIIFVYKTRVLIFSTTSSRNIYHSKKNRARCCHKCTYVFRVNSPLFLSDFNPTFIFLSDLRKIIKYRISGKSVQWK
jgi:tRNA G26 N,N-dimethylase Trm1